MAERLRKLVQAGWGILTNAYLKGFASRGKIYTGPLKHFCVPGLNCYSCPGALGACPIGSLQALFDGRRRKYGFYVIGFLAAVGMLAGRFICGWLCLFGLIQELLYRIPVPKLTVPEKLDRRLRRLKYFVLAFLVIALPLLYRNKMKMGEPFFCKYVCPAGTLEGGIPLVLLNPDMRSALGTLFCWKFFLLILCIIASMTICRPFCKYVCPLGAFYALFQKISLLRMNYDKNACISCGLCRKVCDMNVDPCRHPNSTECIRCGACIHACPKNALFFSMKTGGKTARKTSMGTSAQTSVGTNAQK